MHFVQYLRPREYGLGEGKHGYASLSHRLLHGGITLAIGISCYNAASTRGGGRGKNMLCLMMLLYLNTIAIRLLNCVKRTVTGSVKQAVRKQNYRRDIQGDILYN